MENFVVTLISIVLSPIAYLDSHFVTPIKEGVNNMFDNITSIIVESFKDCVVGLVDLGVAIKEYFVGLYYSFIEYVVDRYHRTINWFCKLPMRLVMLPVRLLLYIWKGLVEIYKPCFDGLREGIDCLIESVLSRMHVNVTAIPKLICTKVESMETAAIVC